MTIEELRPYLDTCIATTDFDWLGTRAQGKVRDIYETEDKIYLVATDRYSAFDRNLTLIPLKGQALTQTSIYNFEHTADIIANHLLGNPDPNVVMCKKCRVAPIEVIVRGYLTGVTDTAIWTRYASGQRDFTDFTLPDGMKKNQPLPQHVITPTTKFEKHDRNLTHSDVVNDGFLGQEGWEQIAEIALALFVRGQARAKQAGLILVDTKYEFGYDENNQLTLIDEVHTQDSSRYWQADTYEKRMANGEEPEYFDKEFLRLWFKEQCDPYKDNVLPKAPETLRVELSRRYIEIYESLTGQTFMPPAVGVPADRIAAHLRHT